MGTVVDVDSGMSWPSSYGDFEYFKKQQNSNRIICSISSSMYLELYTCVRSLSGRDDFYMCWTIPRSPVKTMQESCQEVLFSLALVMSALKVVLVTHSVRMHGRAPQLRRGAAGTVAIKFCDFRV